MESRATVPTADQADLVGERYEILGFVGSGGMGIVYRARDRRLDEIVALKVLRHDLAYDPQALARFRREVKLARRVTHRNVARTFDIGEHEGLSFMTMELVDGEPLSARLERKGPLPVSQAIETAREIASGLVAAHAAGVVHRDLKPDNVLLARDGRVVVTDFGVASADGAHAEAGRRIVGTPPYMAPEQLESPEDVDSLVDVYALGLVLYEMLTGALPWAGESELALATARLVRPPRDPRELRPEISPDLAAVVLGALARSRDERTPTARAFAEKLAAFAPESAATLARESSPSVAPPPEHGRTVAVALRHAGSAEDDYLAAGLAESLVDALAGASVRARVCPAELADRAPHEAGRELGVDAVLVGVVEVEADALVAAVRLVGSRDGLALWAKRLVGTRSHAMSIAAEIARRVSEALTGRAPSPISTADHPEAIDLLLRGRRVYHRFWRTAEAVSLLARAHALCPDDARILSALSLALVRETGLEMHTSSARDAARAHAERAMLVAPSLPDSQVAMGVVRVRDGDTEAGAAMIRRALDLAPGHVDALEHTARLLLETPALEEGIAHAELAVRVEPLLALVLPFHVARARALLGEWGAVDDVFRHLPAEASARATYWLTRARLAVWRDDRDESARLVAGLEADSFSHKAFPEAFARFALERRLGPLERALLTDRAHAPTSSPRQRAFFAQLMTEVLAVSGDAEGALAHLEEAVEDGLFDVAWLDGCGALAPIRAEPRFLDARRVVSARADALVALLLGRSSRATIDP